MKSLFIWSLALLPGLLPAQETPNESRYLLGALLDGSAFARIPAGEFMMGSADGNADEQPIHRVAITKPFEMGKYEVTQAQWNAVMRNPHTRPNTGEGADAVNPSKFKGPSRPVENVAWNEVQQFIRALNIRDPDHIYRLPTEAEWEYASRAGSADDRPKKLDSLAWYEPNSGGETHPVGEKAPNAWGLYDTLGNVLEWVQDWYGMDYYANSPSTDPQGPASGSYRVYRGAGWLSESKYCRHAFRAFDFPSSGQHSVGFRLVRTAKSAP
jgi:formylglycine-generating enzyme required for sulfatase activity